MSYEFITLSEVEVIETSKGANLLVEEDGEIKRLPASNFNTTPNVQADWNETDDTSPAYIANKPTSLGGGDVETIMICSDSGVVVYHDTYERVDMLELTDKYNEGANIIWKQGDYHCKPLTVTFNYNSGANKNVINSMAIVIKENDIRTIYF